MRRAFIPGLLILLAFNITAQESKFNELWNDPQVIEHVDYDIEKYRKGDAEIKIVDKSSKPIKNAIIEVHQLSHELLFGCNLFVLGKIETPELNQKYKSRFTDLFNSATIPFYWRDLEPQEGKPRFGNGSEQIWRLPPSDQLVKWCKTHNITPKGHALMYNRNTLMPDWTEWNDPELFMKQACFHIEGIANRYKNDIPVWDVVNEERYRILNPDLSHKVPDDYLVRCFRIACNLFPQDVKLLYNDDTQNHDRPDVYEGFVNTVIKRGLRIDGMGLQFHLFNLDSRNEFLEGSLYPLYQLTGTYDQLEKTGLPLYITEITIAGNGENGPMLQALIVRNLYRLWFSIKNMAGITWWNLGDGTAYGSENNALGGLLDKNMDPKPAYEELDKLINHEWKTNITLQTGSSNIAKFRGFYGKYRLTVKNNGKTEIKEMELTKGRSNIFIIQL